MDTLYLIIYFSWFHQISDQTVLAVTISIGCLAYLPQLIINIVVCNCIGYNGWRLCYITIFQKISQGNPLITKGPLALFYGGEAIIPLLSSDSALFSNIPIFILIFITLIIYSSLVLYKDLRFQHGIEYEQHLNQVMMSGARNVYGLIIIFLEFLAFTIILVIHLYFIQKYQTESNIPAGPPVLMALVMVLTLLNPFIWNRKLR